MKIQYISCGVEKEPLKTAFGFKGNALTCLWQVAVQIQTEEASAVGLGVQSVLWSDARVFEKYGEEQGNERMYRVTKYALSLLRGETFSTPFQALDLIFDRVYAYAVRITQLHSLSKTFVLNALVPLDLALWQLWLKEHEGAGFDGIWQLPGEKQRRLANIPLITYNTTDDEIRSLALNGTPLLKIKIGSDPNKNGCVGDMLAWDKNRLLRIHHIVKDITVTHSQTGYILYYLDANGRYDSRETLSSLLDFARENGILERTVLLEEPFPEEKQIYVGDLPVCVAADESVHGMEELRQRHVLGYKALTLKPIAKGISMSLRMAEFALQNGMDCFCADLTVNPVMVTWNQCVAARLPKLNGMKVGVVESNGSQNYENWAAMQGYHPMAGSKFLDLTHGVFELEKDFFQCDGGILQTSQYYRTLSEQEVL